MVALKGTHRLLVLPISLDRFPGWFVARSGRFFPGVPRDHFSRIVGETGEGKARPRLGDSPWRSDREALPEDPYVFTGNATLARAIGLAPVGRVPWFNGQIPCRLLPFDLSIKRDWGGEGVVRVPGWAMEPPAIRH